MIMSIDIIGKSGIKFEIARYDGTSEVLWRDIETSFRGVRYKSCTGLNSYGEVLGVYSERYVEEEGVEVYIPQSVKYSQTEIKLTLLFFEGFGLSTDKKDDNVYHEFMEYVSSGKILYRDSSRGRKVLMYLTGVTTPEVDTMYGEKYKQVTFTFTNIYGRSFGYDEVLP